MSTVYTTTGTSPGGRYMLRISRTGKECYEVDFTPLPVTTLRGRGLHVAVRALKHVSGAYLLESGKKLGYAIAPSPDNPIANIETSVAVTVAAAIIKTLAR